MVVSSLLDNNRKRLLITEPALSCAGYRQLSQDNIIGWCDNIMASFRSTVATDCKINS